MDKMRRDFYTCRESDGSDAQPKKLTAEYQNYDADQCADDRDRKVHGRKRILDSHVVEAFAPNAFLFDIGV
jgi:hypothetical protein